MDPKKRAYFNRKEFENSKNSKWQSVLRTLNIAIVVLLIISFLHLSGIYQIQFFKKTPTTVKQQVIENQTEAQTLKIPLTVFIVLSNGLLDSERNFENANHIVENASKIWNQAGVEFYIKKVEVLEIEKSQENLFINNHSAFTRTINQYNFSSINVFLVGTLGGINGLAFGGSNSVAVADYTSEFDFRVLAHEVGHRLGLPHTEKNSLSLMYKGANGTDLSLEEIGTARNTAVTFTGNN